MTYYLSSSDKTIENAITEQALAILEKDSQEIASILDEYRHKAYELSTSQEILAALENPDDENMKEGYLSLYNIMRGDTYLASANIISASGEVHFSTHTFPEKYDIRKYNNEWDSRNILSISGSRMKRNSFSFISIEDHQGEGGDVIFASVFRLMMDDSGELVGYIIIDIFQEGVSDRLGRNSMFEELLLVDNTTFSAYSLTNGKYGSFSDFPEMQSQEYYKASIRLDGYDFELFAFVEKSLFKDNMRFIALIFIISLITGLVISIILSLVFSHSISRRIVALVRNMKKFEQGDFDTQLEEHTGISDFDTLAESFNIMVKRIENLIEISREEEEKLREAERKQLESQMNPHFLFNTLNTIKALAHLEGNEEIYTISLRLGKLLRNTIDNHKSMETLSEAIDMVESYLMIQKIRFPEKLNYRIECPEKLRDVLLPRLIIQPLIENAIIHGLEKKVGSWEIDLSVREEGGNLVIGVSDNGLGFKGEFDPQKASREGHVGLYNVYRRLELRYSKDWAMEIGKKTEGGTVVTIRIPIEREEKNE